ncbi:TetR/AcrR family transcriptional regulator C-terminal domain-containing protein [Actinokineospora sp. NPDC004072]
MTAERVPLSRDRVLHAALAIADAEGIPALTMRRLAADLGVEAMSLYHHVANKEALLDGLVEVIMAEIADALAEPAPVGERAAGGERASVGEPAASSEPAAVGERTANSEPAAVGERAASSEPAAVGERAASSEPAAGGERSASSEPAAGGDRTAGSEPAAGGERASGGWQVAMRARIMTAREVLLRHPWAARVLETRQSISPAVIGYYDGILAIFRAGGFTYDLAHRALHALGSRALGFAQEPFDLDPAAADEAEADLEELAGHYPHLAAMVAEITHGDPAKAMGWCDHQAEFEFGLDLILDGLERLRAQG